MGNTNTSKINTESTLNSNLIMVMLVMDTEVILVAATENLTMEEDIKNKTMEDTVVATDMEVTRSLTTEDMEADTEVITLIKLLILKENLSLVTKDLSSRMNLKNEIEPFELIKTIQSFICDI